jgi:hypothetical protein
MVIKRLGFMAGLIVQSRFEICAIAMVKKSEVRVKNNRQYTIFDMQLSSPLKSMDPSLFIIESLRKPRRFFAWQKLFPIIPIMDASTGIVKVIPMPTYIATDNQDLQSIPELSSSCLCRARSTKLSSTYVAVGESQTN